MNLEQFENRVKELEKAVEQSMANHNVLFGQLGEARYLLDVIKKESTKVAAVAGDVEQAINAVMPQEGEQNGA